MWGPPTFTVEMDRAGVGTWCQQRPRWRELEKEQGQVDGSGGHLGMGWWGQPGASSWVSLHDIVLHNALACCPVATFPVIHSLGVRQSWAEMASIIPESEQERERAGSSRRGGWATPEDRRLLKPRTGQRNPPDQYKGKVGMKSLYRYLRIVAKQHNLWLTTPTSQTTASFIRNKVYEGLTPDSQTGFKH